VRRAEWWLPSREVHAPESCLVCSGALSVREEEEWKRERGGGENV